MSVIGGPNNPISNGLVYALDFKNNRCYVSGSNSAKSLLFNPTTASISAGFDNTTNTLIFSGSQNGTTNLTLPQVNYDKSFTISYVANIKNGGLGFGGNYGGSNTILYTYFDPTAITLGFYGAVTGFNTYFTRTYPASGNNHYTWVYTASGSFTLFVNGVPVSSSVANNGSAVNNGSDFKLSGRASDTFWSGSLGNVYIYNRALTNDEIRTNYTLASREYGLPTPPSFSIDENAYLFSQTAGITSSAYISALDTFVRGLKSASLWDKMVGIYPFLGGNNTLNQLNLKESSLTVYPASFTGSWSSSFSGSRSNTTASYATLTGFTPSTYYPLINTQSFHMAYLSYDTPANSGSLMGATNQVIASGGQVFDMSGSRFHVFTASANLTVTQGGPVQAFVVAGGGGGGSDNGGGGGAGGVVYSSSLSITSGVVPATVGTGGLGGGVAGGGTDQQPGQNSTFGSVVAVGGGRGGRNSIYVGGNGGSGGGGAAGGFSVGGAGTLGQGNSGSNSSAGGGGGAGTSGSLWAGGSGSYYPQYASLGFGFPAGWFGGGGSSFPHPNIEGPGGIGGGGSGYGYGLDLPGGTGSANTGGGGGATGTNKPGGTGGSGIIIVSYPINTGSVLLNATPSDISGSINNTDVNGFFAGGPLGLVMTSRTGSRAYSVSKNKTILNYTSSASSSISNNILLNAVNVNGTASFPIQNNVAYASVGAGLTNDETRTYYDLVDTFQTNLGRIKSTDPNAFITLWDTRLSGISNTSSINYFVDPYSTYTTSIDWGDGTSNTYQYNAYTWPTITHSYAVPGRYLVTQTGNPARAQPNSGYGEYNKVLDIVQWGNVRFQSDYLLRYSYNVVGTAPDAPHSSSLTNFNTTFGISSFRGYVGNWDTSNVTTMNSAFYQNTVYNQPLGTWNVEKVTNMGSMFSYATAFNNGGSSNINNWRPISCSNFSDMFNATSFNQPVGSWPLSASNINMGGMFSSCPFNQDLGSWDVSKVTNMNSMFVYNTAFNNSGSNRINNWRPISCSNFSYMFIGATSFNQPIGNWPLSASNITMEQMFLNAYNFNQDLGAWDVSRVTNMANTFNRAGFNNSGSTSINNWRPISCSNFNGMFAANFNQPIGNWPLSASNITMRQMFYQSPFNQPLGTWDTSRVVDMYYMFQEAGAFNQNIGSWNVEKVTNMNGMFNYATAFNNSGSNTINNWRPISCSNFSSMFQLATAFNQPIGNWPLSASNIGMNQMFDGASSFNQNVGSWDVSKVTSMFWIFRNATNFNNSGSSDINNWRPVSCSDFEAMFQGTVFNQPIGAWTLATDRSINLARMFINNSVFNQDISTWNTSRVTRMDSMFQNAPAFNQPIGSWDTSNVVLMDSMFNSATAFNQNLGSWLIPSCSDMSSMLNNCGMSKANYSATLQGWAAQAPNIKSNVTLGANGRQYDTPGSASRAILTSAPYNWNITGDTFVP